MTLTIGLLAACIALSTAAVALLVFLLFRRRRDTRDAAEAAGRLDTAVEMLEEKLRGANVLRADQLTPIRTELEKLSAEIGSLANTVGRLVATRPPADDPVALEHQILGESWKQFCANKELSAAFDSAAQDCTWEGLLNELTRVVPSDLKPTFDVVIGPCREHRTFVQRLGFIPRVISGNFPRLPTQAEEVRRTRELASLLTNDAGNRLGFRFKSWVTDTFLPFADLYLQRYQQAQLENRHDELGPGVHLVREVLRIAAVEPIDVTPGQTPFDSTRHIGRSTTNDPRFSDGVITGVVRNGFIEGGQQVIRQPEVIVNRMR